MLYFKENKLFYLILILSFSIFSIFLFYSDTNSKIYIFISTITGGILSACILYYIVEIIPIEEKKKNSLEVLNKTICSILEAYFKPNIFQHEKSIKYVSLDYIDSVDKIKKAQNDIKNFNITYLQLKYPIETAHSRYNDFQNLLILANNLSPNHSLLWLDLIEKIRLMSENYEEYKNLSFDIDINLLDDLVKCKNFNDKNNQTYYMCSSFQIRVLEFFESVENWIEKT